MKRLKTALLAGALLALPSVGWAACQVEGTGEVNVISNAFPSLEHIAKAMQECNGNGVTVTVKLTTEHEEETTQAFGSGTSPFEIAQVSNGSFTPLYAKGLLQPMTDLVEKYKDKYKIEDSMLVTFDGEVYAIAFQSNLQYLFYRKDLFEKHGIEVPKTYDELLAAAEKLKGEEGIEFPLAGPYKAGWNIATEFTNLYLSMGGEFFKPGTAEPAFNNEKAVATLELIKKLMAHMSPNSLALATGDVTTSFQQGTVAMSNMWASRAGAMDDAAVSKVVDKIGFAPSPATVAGGPPASAVWWDGFVMPKSMDGDRDLAFQVLMEGLDEETVMSGADLANWLRSVYKPTRYSEMVMKSMEAGAASWPTEPFFDLAHGAIGNAIPDFLSGKESAEQSLKDAEAAYLQAAKEQGYL
jgi:multiple sugar transport system substrate-binding protein